jgi:hypothetical protein
MIWIFMGLSETSGVEAGAGNYGIATAIWKQIRGRITHVSSPGIPESAMNSFSN